jgi:hypothetical protein
MSLAAAGRLPLTAATPREANPEPLANVGSLVTTLALCAAPALALAIAVARGAPVKSPWIITLGITTLLLNAVVIARDLRIGLALFIVTAGLSPKLPGLYNNLRVEDFVFVLVFGIWLFKYLRAGRLPIPRGPMVAPFAILTLLSLLSTIYGMWLGTVSDQKYAIFLQAKRIEYFLIFWVVASTVRDEGWLRLLTLVFVGSGAIASLYGLMHASDDDYVTVAEKRVTGPEGENYNTLSGYLVVCIGAGLAALPGFRRRWTRRFLFACLALTGGGLLWSFSREGYVMLVGSLLVFGFTKHRWVLIAAAGALVTAIVVAPPVRQNFEEAFVKIQESGTADPGSNSLTARYRAWEFRWNTRFIKQPLVGNGVGSVALSVDNEYLLRACEVGLLGFSVFVWWLVSIGQQVWRLKRVPGMPQLLGLGLAAGFVGLLIQGTVGASFTTIRTMEPFWFLLGLVAAAVAIRKRAMQAEQRAVAGEGAGLRPAGGTA